MSRYASVISLVKVELEQNDEGSLIPKKTYREVFANRFEIGFSSWAEARSAGLNPEASFKLRSCDYEGEEMVVVDGTEYDVTRVSNSGEFTKLTLTRRMSNERQDGFKWEPPTSEEPEGDNDEQANDRD